jgi:hypothetical protein
MTGDPERDEEERARRDALHDIESWARRQPPPEPGQPPADPVHVIRVRLSEEPGIERFSLCRWSTAARLVRDAADAGQAAQVTDLGPDAMRCAQIFDPATLDAGRLIVHVGVARGDRWLAWKLWPYPPEPVPGSRQWGAGRN